MALIDNVVLYWKADEVSGNLIDSIGLNHAVENGSSAIPSVAGKLNNARELDRTEGHLFSIVDNPSLSTGDVDFAWISWFVQTSYGGYPSLISKDNGTLVEYQIYNDDVSHKMFFYVGDGGSDGYISSISHGAISLSVWTLLAVWHDSIANTLNIQINNGAVDSVAHTTGVLDTNYQCNIGVLNGILDDTIFWKGRVPTQLERDFLWNNGDGQLDPFNWKNKVRTSRFRPNIFAPGNAR